jgi:lysozyme
MKLAEILKRLLGLFSAPKAAPTEPAPAPAPAPAPEPAPAPPPEPAPKQKGKGLTALVGVVGVVAAAQLFTSIPADESGRAVEAKVVAPTYEQLEGNVDSEQIILEHKAGPRHLKAYRDIVGVWTACDGIAYVEAGATFTPEQCDAMLEAALVKHAAGVLKCTPRLKEPGRDYQRAAAVSLAYNVGVGAYCRSTVDRLFDAGEWRGGCRAFAMWNKAGGRVVQGLVNRRARERETCETNVVAGKTPENLPARLKGL